MKAIVVGPDYFNYTSSVAWALRELNCQAIEITCKSFFETCSYVGKKINKIGFKGFEERYYREWNQNLRSIYCEYQPDLCIVLNGNFIDPANLKMFKENNTKLILWLIDSIKRLPESEKNLSFYDEILSFEQCDEHYLYEKYRIKCSYCPVGYDPRVYYPDDNVVKDIDISFVGSPVAKRIEILQPIAAYAQQRNKVLATFGRFWDETYFWKKSYFAKKNSPLQLYAHNSNIQPEEVAQIYRRSKICLNIHVADHEGVNPRTFEILGTKSFQLVDKKPKMGELVNVGQDLIEYEDINDLIDKIEYYLAHNDLRIKIANNGYECAKNNYMINKIVASILTKNYVAM